MKRIFLILFLFIFVSFAHAQIITTVAGSGFGGDGGPATSAFLDDPACVVVDATGNIFIADANNNRVRKVNTYGIIITYAGNGIAGYSGDGSAATDAKLHTPGAVALDRAGNLYIAELANNCIRKVSVSGVITTIAGNGTSGYGGDGGPATSAIMDVPAALALDSAGNIYIADDGNNRIRKISTSGVITTIAGVGFMGFSGDGGAATAANLHFPAGVAVDHSGNVYISDGDNYRIRKVNTAGIISTIAGTGTPGYSGDGGPATLAQLQFPYGLATDAMGTIYIADGNNNKVRKIDSSGIIRSVAGNGVAGSIGDGAPATAAELNIPKGVAVGCYGIYIADETNGRIRRISNSGPTPTIGLITGPSSLCAGTTISLTDTSSSGTWSSDMSYIAAAGTTGIVSGLTNGTAIISYSANYSCGTIAATKSVIVNPLPVTDSISGLDSVCHGLSITLTDLTSGGIWSVTNSNASISSGVFTGITGGLDSAVYSVSNSCGVAHAYKSVYIIPPPWIGAIYGMGYVCSGSTIGLFCTPPYGGWSVSNSNATINSLGWFHGLVSGRDTVTYTVTNGCGVITATWVMTINPLPSVGVITGSTFSICPGSTTNLADSIPGGSWSTTNGNALVTPAGVVTGVMGNTTDSVYYTYTTDCGTVVAGVNITVNPMPNAGAITGIDSVCTDSVVTLTDTIPGGIWSNTDAGITFVSGGIVTGITTGQDTIMYIIANSCGTAIAELPIYVIDCNNTGLNSLIGFEHDFTLYPNPALNKLTITSTCTITTISLSDIEGQIIFFNKYNTNLVEIYVADLLAGIYFVKINGTDMRRFVKE